MPLLAEDGPPLLVDCLVGVCGFDGLVGDFFIGLGIEMFDGVVRAPVGGFRLGQTGTEFCAEATINRR